MSADWDGLLAIDKPPGPTSHDIVARVRSAAGIRRVGHTGTLDPQATGLLLLVLGRATRLARFVPDGPKTYRGELELGVSTTSDDLSGEVLRRHTGPFPSPDAVRAAALERLGRQLQTPPAYSARSVGGTRLYRLARRGVVVEAPASEIVVDRFDVVPTDSAERWAYEIVASKGTYVRAAVRDLGGALGCGAAVASIRRTAIGPFTVESAVALPEDRKALRDAAHSSLVPIDAVPLAVSSIHLPADDCDRFRAGRTLPWPASDHAPGLVAVRDERGTLQGVGLLGDGSLRPRVVV